MTSNKALILIRHHIRKMYRKPLHSERLDRTKYQHRVYMNWAANEIESYIDRHRNWEPINAVEEFRYMMDKLACSAKDSKKNFMFSTAYDVATDILDVLLSEES